MGTRIWIGLVTVSWVAMTVLLCRSEFGARRQLGGSIPAAMVWQKMLTAPDQSTLEIRYHTNRIGYCRWRPDVGQELATGAILLDDEDPMEGMVHQLSHYTLDVDGNFALPDFPTRIRFSMSLRLDTNQMWRTFDTRVVLRPDFYELSANAAAQTLQLRFEAGADRMDRRFRFADLQNPQKLLLEFGGPMLPMMVAAAGVPLGTNSVSPTALGLRWEARNDSIVIGKNRVRAYRLQAKIFDRYKITFYVSPVGEILRGELPGGVTLINDQLAGLGNTADHD